MAPTSTYMPGSNSAHANSANPFFSTEFCARKQAAISLQPLDHTPTARRTCSKKKMMMTVTVKRSTRWPFGFAAQCRFRRFSSASAS